MSRYIDANKLIERLMHSPLFLIAPKNSKDGIIDLIVSRPTADVVEVRHGEWILKDSNGKGVCSVCNRLDRIDSLATHCRYCGAKMDGERKE